MRPMLVVRQARMMMAERIAVPPAPRYSWAVATRMPAPLENSPDR